jgi:hypothetical protein
MDVEDVATNRLDALKDYLELARNFVFGNGLVVIAGSVVRDRAAIGDFAARCIVWVLVCASFAYIAAAIFYVERRHKPETPTRKQRVLGGARTALLFVLMEASLIMVGHHVDRENRLQRDAHDVIAAKIAAIFLDDTDDWRPM